MRVKFKKKDQRKFLKLVVRKLNCISLRGILQFGFDVSYDNLKGYYGERRLLPKDFFDDLCHVSKINPKSLNVEYVEDNWGQIKGGKKSKRFK
jgi:hypothetical protein